MDHFSGNQQLHLWRSRHRRRRWWWRRWCGVGVVRGTGTQMDPLQSAGAQLRHVLRLLRHLLEETTQSLYRCRRRSCWHLRLSCFGSLHLRSGPQHGAVQIPVLRSQGAQRAGPIHPSLHQHHQLHRFILYDVVAWRGRRITFCLLLTTSPKLNDALEILHSLPIFLHPSLSLGHLSRAQDALQQALHTVDAESGNKVVPVDH
mmetsp:Transcript_64532/g.141506  ORF Transcript_64532/g.141506 Transcript_64532/m.141506 type:complete len:203 (+) Transcript_64532:79-687(+)